MTPFIPESKNLELESKESTPTWSPINTRWLGVRVHNYPPTYMLGFKFLNSQHLDPLIPNPDSPRIIRESFTSVTFTLPAKEPRVPRFVVFTVLATSAAALFALFLWCRCNRHRQRKSRKAAYRCVQCLCHRLTKGDL